MRVLVTGGSGYLGGPVISALLDAGHAPVVFSRRGGPGRAGVTFVPGDVRDAGAVRSAMAGCDGVCHMAALVSIAGEPREFDAVNVTGLLNALDAARELHIGRFVYTSSFLAHPPRGLGEPLQANDYQRTKVAALRVARRTAQAGQPLVVVSPGVLYGPGVMSEGNLVGRLLSDHMRRRLPGVVGPERTWSFSYVGDVARGHVAALERGGTAEYALGGPNLPQQAVFDWLRCRAGRRQPRRVPYPVAFALGALEELRSWATGSRPLLTRAAVEIFRYDWPLDSTAARRDLGYAITPLEAGLEAVWPELPHRRVERAP